MDVSEPSVSSTSADAFLFDADLNRWRSLRVPVVPRWDHGMFVTAPSSSSVSKTDGSAESNSALSAASSAADLSHSHSGILSQSFSLLKPKAFVMLILGAATTGPDDTTPCPPVAFDVTLMER